MSSMNIKEWMEQAEYLVGELTEFDGEISRQNRLTGRHKRNYARKLEFLTGSRDKLEVQFLKHEANASSYNLSPEDINMRRNILTKIGNLVFHVQGLISDKDQQNKDSMYARNLRPAEETEETRNMNNMNLLENQQNILNNQDEKLNDVLSGVTTLKNMSYDMHSELNLHVKLLDDVDEGVTRADRRIKENITNVDGVQEAQSGCCPTVTMILLFVIIVFVALSDAPCAIFG